MLDFLWFKLMYHGGSGVCVRACMHACMRACVNCLFKCC